ncbi:hypothetical protein J6590_072989 [Homalodisca vitripennis]|nr:hypothetical protein J6590_072989 [Homalodisca vitripennis]
MNNHSVEAVRASQSNLNQVTDLIATLKEEESDLKFFLVIAAEAGKALLEENQRSQNQLEELLENNKKVAKTSVLECRLASSEAKIEELEEELENYTRRQEDHIKKSTETEAQLPNKRNTATKSKIFQEAKPSVCASTQTAYIDGPPIMKFPTLLMELAQLKSQQIKMMDIIKELADKLQYCPIHDHNQHNETTPIILKRETQGKVSYKEDTNKTFHRHKQKNKLSVSLQVCKAKREHHKILEPVKTTMVITESQNYQIHNLNPLPDIPPLQLNQSTLSNLRAMRGPPMNAKIRDKNKNLEAFFIKTFYKGLMILKPSSTSQETPVAPLTLPDNQLIQLNPF